MGKVRGAVLVQPPFVQLNSPYPAPYYLKSFLEKRGLEVTVLDHSIALFERIFCRQGLERIFDDAVSPAYRRTSRGESALAHVVERFFSERDLWLASIERLVAFLRGRDPEWGHFLALANGSVPGGPRADAYIAERRGEVSPDEAKVLATKLLDDLADFIACTLDSGFSLIRYVPAVNARLDAGFRDFAVLEKSLDGYVMDAFYRPMLGEEWETLEKRGTVPGRDTDGGAGSLFLLGLTIPFPGCLAGALCCAESAKKRFGSAVRTVAGGGYVNTELRFMNTPRFFEYFDYVSFDRGYGSLVSVLDQMESGVSPDNIAPHGIAVIDDDAPCGAGTVFPDYSEVDFGRYLYPVDDVNPMHRLWSDGHWLKAYLAHGCYWHSCAFCDTSLDYIKNFIPVNPASLFAHLVNQAENTGVRGIHLVDEAAPVSSLLEFALLNREAGLPLNFWGNIRFERDFTPGAAAILAAGGLTGVSAGLEVPTEMGFRRLGKGIDLECAVRACAAFKEAGILTHAYLIYGYWDEDGEEIVNSAEIARQLFAAKLLDSAFWHRFVLTRHSRIYAEKQRGQHPGLIIKGEGGDTPVFALNDLSFEGEEKFDKYSEPLDALLGAWMRGDTKTPVAKAFPFKVSNPSVSPRLVDDLLDMYIRDRDAGNENGNVLFLGSAPRPELRKGNHFLKWRWRLEDRELWTSAKEEAEQLIRLLEKASAGKGMPMDDFYSSLKKIANNKNADTLFRNLRENGLAVYRVS